MFEKESEVWADIDVTLIQLMENSEAMRHALAQEMNHEVEALQRLQESLLARLMHRHELVGQEKRERSRTQNCAKVRSPSSRSRGCGRTASSKILQ